MVVVMGVAMGGEGGECDDGYGDGYRGDICIAAMIVYDSCDY